MERTYESAAALASRATGPLANDIGRFVGSLRQQQYTASVLYIKALHAIAFDRWLEKRRIVSADLDEAHVKGFQSRTRRQRGHTRAETRAREWFDVMHLLQFLRARGVCRPARLKATPAEDMAARYAEVDDSGLSLW